MGKVEGQPELKEERENEVRVELTEDENRRISKNCSRDSDPLLLTSTEVCSSIPKLRLIPIWQSLDEVVHQSRSTSGDDFLPRHVLRSSRLRSSESESNILMDAHVEEDAPLLDRSDVLLHPRWVEKSDLLVVERDGSSSWAIELEEELRDGRLS